MPRMLGTARAAMTAAGGCEPRWGERITAATTTTTTIIITITTTGGCCGGGGFGSGGGEGGGSSVLALASVQRAKSNISGPCAARVSDGFNLNTARYSYR